MVQLNTNSDISHWFQLSTEALLLRSGKHINICYERKGNTYEPEYRYELLPQYLDQHKRSNQNRKDCDELMMGDSVLYYI